MARRIVGRWTRALWPAGVAGLALAAWLFLPQVRPEAPQRPSLRVLLVDVSASVTRTRAWLPWVRSELRRNAEEARAAGEDLAVLSYAQGVSTGYPPGAADRFLDRLDGSEGAPFVPGAGLGRAATHLADGLAAAAACLEDSGRPAGSLVLLAPPDFTGRSPSSELARLAAAGVPVVAASPPSNKAGDLGLLDLVVAPWVEAEAPLVALTRLIWQRGESALERATLQIEVECDGLLRRSSLELALPAQDGEFELPIDCGPAGFGRNELRVRCQLSSGTDRMPENDVARASCTADGARPIGVAVRPEQRAAAEAWLAPAGRSGLGGLQFLFLTPEELVHELEGLAALVTFDLSLDRLPAPLLESFVRSGGGWLALSGFGFLNDWIPGERGGPLHELLPVEPATREAPPRDVLLLVDGSGSMEGEAFDSVRAAALELVAAALPSDRVSLRFFTVNLEREHLLKARSGSRAEDQDAARHAARELLALRVPSGTTFLLRSLREVAAQAGENETLALLLTDGWERDALPDVIGLAQTVAGELLGARTRLVVIAVGEPNTSLLAILAGGEERVRSGGTLEDLRGVFHRELHGPQLAQGEFPVRLAERSPGSLADEVAHSGAETPELAPLECYVRNRLRPTAESLWISTDGDPLLSLVRAGLGRVAVFASLPEDSWASRYVRAGLGQPAEFEGLLRWLARGPERSSSARAQSRGGRLRISGLPPSTPARLRVRLLELGGEEREEDRWLVPPAEPGANVLGTREGALGWGRVEEVLVRLPDEVGGAVLSLEGGLEEEFAGRGRTLTLPSTPPERHSGSLHPAAGSRSAAVWVLGVSLALFFFGGALGARGQGLQKSSR